MTLLMTKRDELERKSFVLARSQEKGRRIALEAPQVESAIGTFGNPFSQTMMLY